MWYNIGINMDLKRRMLRRTYARVRYSAAYPTGAERIAKGPSLPWGLTPLCSAAADTTERERMEGVLMLFIQWLRALFASERDAYD